MCGVHVQLGQAATLHAVNLQSYSRGLYCTSLQICHVWTSVVWNICTHTAWWKPRQARRCSSCPVWGIGNSACWSSVGISSESNLWGQRLEKARGFEKNRPRSTKLSIWFIRGGSKMWGDPREKDTSKFSGKLNIMQKNIKPHSHERQGGRERGSGGRPPPTLLIWPVFVLWIRKRMMSTWCSVSFCPNCVNTNLQTVSHLMESWPNTDLQQKMFHPGRWGSSGWAPG